MRGANALAGEIRNANGCSIVNTVFNDTLVLSGDPADGVVNRGTSVTGCDFRPNKGVIDPATNLPSGTGSDAGYDTFIRVDGLKDVMIGDNSFCVDSNGLVFGSICHARGNARVNLTAAISSEYVANADPPPAPAGTSVKNYRNPVPIAIGPNIPQPDTTVLDYDLRDIFTGARNVGTLSNASVADAYPAARATDLISDNALQNYKGYRILDGGALQAYAPDFTDDAMHFETAADGSTFSIGASARYFVAALSANIDTLTLKLPTAPFNKQLRVVVRGGNVAKLNWLVAASSGDTIADDAFLPKRVAGLVDVQLIRKRAAGGTAAAWYVVNSERLSMFVQVGLDNDALAVSTTNQVATLRAPRPMQITEVRGSLRGAPSSAGSKVEFDVRKNVSGTWTSIFTTTGRPSIDPGELTTVDAATPPKLNAAATSLLDDQELAVFITSVGSPTPGKGLKVWIVGQTA